MFPFDNIKVDKSFVQSLETRPACAAIVAAAVTLAKKLRITTTAEGVETLEQFNALVSAGIDSAQGYLLDRPMLVTDFNADNHYGHRLLNNAAATASGPSQPKLRRAV